MMSEIWIWLVLIAIAIAIMWAARPVTIYDSPYPGYIVYNESFGNPALEGRLFYTRRGAERSARILAKDVPWAHYSVRKMT